MRQVVRISDAKRGHVDKDPALAVDHSDKLWVAWHNYRPKQDRIMLRRCSRTRRGELLEVSDRAGINFQPGIACDGQDRTWVVWTAIRDNRWCILVRPAGPDGLGPVVRLAESTGELAFPSITADGYGRIWTAWCGVQDGRHQVFGRFLSKGRWSEAALLSHGPGEHYRPVLCGDREDAWIAWETCRNGAYDLFARRWTTKGPDRPVKFSMTDSWEMSPRLCSDGQGGVWAVWIATHDVTDHRGFIDHQVEAMAAHFDAERRRPYRGPDRSKPAGYVTHLYDGLLGRHHYMGFLGRRRCPQVVREPGGDVWMLYERKQDERFNRRGPDALFYARPLTGRDQTRCFLVDQDAYAYTVNGDVPVLGGRLHFAGQIPAGKHFAAICAGTVDLDRSRPVRQRPAAEWKHWKPIRLPAPAPFKKRPTMTTGGKTYRLYWGDLHCHGDLSGDAEGRLDESYAYGRHKARLDFMAVSENDAIYDNVLTPSEWALVCAEAEHFNDPGRFVAISAYERTCQKDVQPGPNHRIILFPRGRGPLYRWTESDADTLEKWITDIEPTDAFEFAHHGTWRAKPCSRLGGVDVTSSWEIYIQTDRTIPHYLRQGYRLAFLGGSDTHRIVPGLGGALTGVWARDLSRAGIFEALWAGRCFATNGTRMVLDLRIDGRPMGSQLEASGEVTVRCRVQAPRPVRKIELYRDGRKVLQRAVGKRRASLKLTDRPGPGAHFYYVHVELKPLPRAPMRGRCGNLQVACGDYAWSSPIRVNVGQTA